MYFRQLAKLRALVEDYDRKGILEAIAHPSSYTQRGQKSGSLFFYHRESGRVLFAAALIPFLTEKLRLKDEPSVLEGYFTAYSSAALMAEVIAYLDLMPRVKLAASFASKLTSGEQAALMKEYHFAFLSLLSENGDEKQAQLLTEGFFRHYFFSITYPTPTRKNVRDWCLGIIKTRYGTDAIKESVRPSGEDFELRLIVDTKEAITLRGKSIKTLRGQAYRALLLQLLDE